MNPSPQLQHIPGPPRTPPSRARKAVSRLARSTILAAGLVASQMLPEIDPRFHLFSPKLVDRLRAPISRYRD